jgi:iron complex transport system substrate-binding protein
VLGIAQQLPSSPQVTALDPRTFAETIGDIRTVALATDSRDAALALIDELRRRVDRVKIAVKDAPRRTVCAIEWYDPVYIAGHWTPQLIELAGGIDVLGLPGEHSEVVSWEQIAAASPDVVVCMPCGYDAPTAREHAQAVREELAALGATTVVAVDAAAYFSRPGPRLVDGLEVLAHILHPDLVPEAPGPALPVLDAARA